MKAVIDAGIESFYASADTDPFTMFLRASAMRTGYETSSIEQQVKEGHTSHLDATLAKLNHIRWDFSSRIEADPLESQLRSYAYVYGAWPSIIVLDNISNFDLEGAGEGYQKLEDVCDFAHDLARQTGAAVIGLHHVTGEYDDGIKPVPQNGLRGKVSKVPELILTLYRDPTTGTSGSGNLYVCPVKNRTGAADPSGGLAIPLHYEPSRMLLRDKMPTDK